MSINKLVTLSDLLPTVDFNCFFVSKIDVVRAQAYRRVCVCLFGFLIPAVCVDCGYDMGWRLPYLFVKMKEAVCGEKMEVHNNFIATLRCTHRPRN